MFWQEKNYYYNRGLNNLPFWYSILTELWIPTPETYIIEHKVQLIYLLDGKVSSEIEWCGVLINDIDVAAQKVWYPCFIRTWHSSNKHDWKDSCYLEKKEDIIRLLCNLTEHSYMADMFKAWPVNTIVVRKLIQTKPFFRYFRDMPITREVRMFLKDWKIESIHPYWPKEAFDWENKELLDQLKELNNISQWDREFLKKIWTFIAVHFDWYWSCDFLQRVDWEWICIDMAVWENSYKNNEKYDLWIK